MMKSHHQARRERNKALSRRTILRGAGVTMALPWLESLSGFGISSASAATTAGQPQRFAVLFMGTGISIHESTTSNAQVLQLDLGLER